METSLRFDSGNKHLKLFAKEKFCNDDDYVLTVRRPARAGDGPYPTFHPREGRFTLDPPRRRSPARASTPSHGDRPFDEEPRADLTSLSIHAAQVSGSLDTRDGRVESRAYVRKKFFPSSVLSRVDMGLSYATTQDDVKYGVAGKRTFELDHDGLLTLDVKGGCMVGSKGFSRPDVAGSVELTKKIFNFVEDQDLKLRLGYDLCERGFYGQIRENNWTFNTNFRDKWDVKYDL